MGGATSNGRIYDSTLGRFCSADPFIDDAKDAQSYNRYSYVNNNPLRYVDPSGFFKFEDAVKFLMVAVITYVSYGTLTEVAGGLVGFWGTKTIAAGGAAFMGAFSGSLLNGASVGDAFRTGLITGVAAAVTAGFLGKISGMDLHDFERGFLHGLLHGSVAEATGGEFRHGFYSGFVAGATDASVAKWVKDDVARGTAAAAIIGGTVAELGGGKFANGAAQGAFSYMFNQAASTRTKEVQDHLDLLKVEADAGNEFALEAYDLLTRDGVTITFEDSVYLEGKSVYGATVSKGSHGQFDSAEIRIQRGLSTDETLAVLVHESAHVLDATLSFLLQGRQSVEIRAHIFEEQYRVRKGLPAGGRGFQKGPKNNRQVNPKAIEKWVEKHWPASDGGLINF